MPTLQEEYDVLAGELRGLNVRLDLPEDDGISQAQPIGAEYDALAGELRGLNARLGLPENDGIPLTSSANSEYENLVRQNNALDQRLSALFPTFDEWNAEQDELDKRSNWEATKTFKDNFITGAGAMWDEGVKALDELTSGKAGWESLGGIWEVGKRDFGRFAKTMGGAAEDWLPTTESERSREYRRAKENFDYYQTVRPLMVDAVGGDAKNLVSFGAQFVDPFMVLPVAGIAAKAGAVGLKSARLGRTAAALDKVGDVVSIPSKAVAAATRKGLKGTAYVAGKAAGLVGTAGGGVEKLARLPRNLASKVAQKVLPESIAGGAGGALFTGQLVGAASGAVPFAAQLGIGEIAGFIANRTGKGLEKILTTLAAPGAQQRFLQRLAQTAESPRMRRWALIAHRKLGLTKAGDVAFNALVNGASIASINGALAYLSGESAEGIGQAAGAGMTMGGVMPFGQPGQKAGKAQSSRDATSINYLEGKLASEQVKEFRKLEPEARLVAATAEEAGIPIPNLFFVDSKLFLKIMQKTDPNAREAQSAMYAPEDKTIYVNQDISSKSSSRAVMQMFTEELGHHFITEAIKTDPMFGHQILAEYKAKEGEKSHTFIFERDPDGNPLRTIEINEKGKKLADAYSSISDDVNVGIGNNANTLAQEIGAAQFSIMMDENPNLFPHLAQPIRHKLVNASQKILSLMGITDKFGNTLPLNIASKLKRSPAIRNLYRNYLKQREMHMAGKIDLAEKGQSIPLKRGESAQAGAERLFGATGLSLKDAKAFIINNKQIKRELTNLKNRYQDAPADGWSVVRGRLIGKKLTPEMRVIFTRTNPDPRGSVNIIINDVQAAIADNSEVNFLFRSGKPSKYSDNELKVRVVAPVGFEISGMAGKGAATLYMQAMDIAYLKNNVEVLVQEGFIKNPDKFIAEARQVAKDAVSDPEGRINPEGKFENELITVALGNKASADFIKNPKLARLLEEGRLQHSFRQYRIGELAGIALTGRPGIGFDWYNVKRNYSPHGRNFMPTEVQKRSAASAFKPKTIRDNAARTRTFKSPVHLADGSRLSGVADNPEQNPFYGFDRNGKEFSVRREYIKPETIVKSRDSDRTANIIRAELERGDKLFMPRRKPGQPDDTIPLPFPELPGDIPGEGFGRMINVDKSKSEMAEAKRLADEQDGFSNSGTVRAKNADGRDKLFMPADRALGLPDNIRDEVLPGIKQDKFSRGQLEAALLKSAGSKAYAEEIGLMDWLKDRKSVTKAEVDQFVRENAPRLEEKVLEMTDPGGGPNPPKFSDYQEPGGTNYREVLVKLPEKSANNSEMQALRQEAQSILEKKQALEAEGKYFDSNMLNPKVGAINARIQKLQSQDNFRDPHFNEDNVLLHLRLNDRIDANGKKVLFIEELQSDWHQKGRKDGYASKFDNLPDTPARHDDIIVGDNIEGWGKVGAIRRVEGKLEFNVGNLWIDKTKFPISRVKSRSERFGPSPGLKADAVPDAPFKKNWPALGLKRTIREALENGYDRIAWLDGEGQAARYDLSKQVDSIVHLKNKDGTYDVEVVSGNRVAVHKENLPAGELADLVGKEIAQKIIDGKASDIPRSRVLQIVGTKKDTSRIERGWRELSGVDLKVGGEGMKAFYDRELVSIANKISKKIGGGKVRRETRLEAGVDSQEFGSHVLDLPKNPQAVENLRLYMPAQKAPSDSGVPTILRDLPAKGRGALVQPRAIESGFGTENIDAPKFVDKVLGDLKVDVQRTNFEKPEVNLADHYGKNALLTMTDRTPTDHVIYGINDVLFKTPLRLEGGRDYMYDSAHSPGAAWANEQNAMTAMLNRREKLGGEDMLVIPMEMAPTSVDFPTMAPALHIRYAQVAMKAKDKRYVNSLVKKGGKGFLTDSQDQVKVPKFDIDMENVEAFLSKLTGRQRKTINNVFDMVNRPSSGQKKKGVRQIDGALSNFEMRAAISDPAMFNQKSLMQTTNVGLMTGGQAPSMHSTYNAAMRGEGLGVLKVPEGFQPKAQDFLPDLFKKSNKDYVHPNDAFKARMGVRTTKIDDALLKRLGL